MKQFNCIGKALLILSLMFTGVVSAHGEWELMFQEKTGTRTYFDPDSMIELIPGYPVVQLKTYWSKDVKQKWFKEEVIDNVKKFEYTEERIEIDCQLRRFHLLALIFYTEDGEVIRTTPLSLEDMFEWHDIEPRSHIWSTMKRVCIINGSNKEKK
jgi:hypothetical protein